MKTGIDSYCFHRLFRDIYDNQHDPGKKITYQELLNRAIEPGVAEAVQEIPSRAAA